MTTDKNNSQATVPMWWDGGDRAITAREKARIEEHGRSCFSIALVPATPTARWAVDGLIDPHAGRYACERAALTLGNLTDDELANAVYLHGNDQPSMADLVAGKALSGIAYLTAAKDRIRWLSRALAATCKEPLQVGEVQGDGRAQFEAWNNSLPSLYRYNLNRWSNEAQEYRSRHTRAAFTAWQAALAARQPGAQAPVATVHVTHGGFGMELATHVAYALPVGTHSLYAAPPAQAIDLGVTEEEREWIDYAIAHMRDDSEPEDLTCADALEQLLRRIDGQRDAAPGVGNG
ncbi:hypothetical protein SOM22_08455 [Stenotrophomonas rhizophila]|uniref:hypothetical protein n=1 Tax=Stenotrophomonas rhizophila TaxID=216778 RepID=UPI002A6AA518|nr:hypothetical protein [Stenotrophomonas rhizophila]MDY0954605.1 hypothetical protein [Stenotrophomonas rhizophila]